jgi:hypothetical protein
VYKHRTKYSSPPLFELQHPPLYLISNSNLGINIQLKRSCKDLSPLKMFFGTIPTFLKGIIHNCGYWLITVFKILYGKHRRSNRGEDVGVQIGVGMLEIF